MSQITLTAGANPAFLTASYFTRYADQKSDLIVSSGVDLRHRLYDMDPAAIWQGENANDAIDETITAGLWLSGFQGSRDVDFIAVLGHNLKDFDVKLSNDNGGTYPTSYVTLGETNNYTLRSVSAVVAADKFRVVAHNTQTANQYKQIGAIILAKGSLQTTVGMSIFKIRPPRIKDKTARMHDNSVRRSYVYRSDASLHFNDFSVGFDGLVTSEADSLESILLGNDPFIFFPEPGDRPSKIYLGQVVPGTYTRDYFTRSRAGGWTITFDFEEIGGA